MNSKINTKKYRAAVSVVKSLQDQGFEALFAGGSVRDLLLGRTPKDFDITTNATPEQIEKNFQRTIPIGRQFGILVVVVEGEQFEVATFRGEGGYSDRRRPDKVYWTSAKQDALRRDFTVNALFLNPISNQIIDYTGGQIDLKNKIIRFVGNPDARAREDHLRILRAVRLKNMLGFQYDQKTYLAVKRHSKEIKYISSERIRDELNRMWDHPSRAESLKELTEFNLLKEILPEIDILRGVPQPIKFHEEGDVFEHTIRALAALPPKAPTFLVWATLLHDSGKAVTLQYPNELNDRIRFDDHRLRGAEIARQVAVRLKLPRVEIDTIAWLIEHHMNLAGIEKMREAKRRAYLLDPRFKWLLELNRADALGTQPASLKLYNLVKKFYEKYHDLWKKEQKTGHPKPLLGGNDLIAELGLEPGKKLGQILAKLSEAQLERKIETREQALALAKKLLKK